MKNFEKYEEEIKKINYNIAVNAKNNTVVYCYGISCDDCLFNNNCNNETIIKWLYEEYSPKTQLTIEEIEELLKDKYPNGIEVV